jgi:hypothetical protein
MANIQSFEEIYVELCEHIAINMPHINHQDLWHEQIGFLDEEHPWEGPAIFYEFRGVDVDELGDLAQHVDLQIDIYLYYETFLDTNHGSYNQSDALAYLKDLSNLNKYLHGYAGTSIDDIGRIGFSRVQTGGSGNLYRSTFVGRTRDHSAVKEFDTAIPNEVDVESGLIPHVAPSSNKFKI